MPSPKLCLLILYALQQKCTVWVNMFRYLAIQRVAIVKKVRLSSVFIKTSLRSWARTVVCVRSKHRRFIDSQWHCESMSLRCVELTHSYVRAQGLNGVLKKTLIYLRRTCFFDTGGISCLPKKLGLLTLNALEQKDTVWVNICCEILRFSGANCKKSQVVISVCSFVVKNAVEPLGPHVRVLYTSKAHRFAVVHKQS
jgi:hypothetical protein